MVLHNIMSHVTPIMYDLLSFVEIKMSYLNECWFLNSFGSYLLPSYEQKYN